MRRLLTTTLHHTALAVLALVAAATAQAGPAPPGTQPINPTHYWTYHMEPGATLTSSIVVRDQFFRLGVPVTVDHRERLLNWVIKNGSAVQDTFVHYTWWNIVEKVPVNRRVIVTNQFGSFPVDVLNLEFLLAPAFKFGNPTGGQGGPLANHYLCYRATGFPGPAANYDLIDEWHRDSQNPGAMEFLCAPCAKQHQGITFPPVDTLTHLAAYPVSPTFGAFSPPIIDQFVSGSEFVHQLPIEYLFVPSEKTDLPVDAKRSTWGRVKQIYR